MNDTGTKDTEETTRIDRDAALTLPHSRPVDVTKDHGMRLWMILRQGKTHLTRRSKPKLENGQHTRRRPELFHEVLRTANKTATCERLNDRHDPTTMAHDFQPVIEVRFQLNQIDLR